MPGCRVTPGRCRERVEALQSDAVGDDEHGGQRHRQLPLDPCCAGRAGHLGDVKIDIDGAHDAGASVYPASSTALRT